MMKKRPKLKNIIVRIQNKLKACDQDRIDSLKHTLKEIYKIALFDWDTMPEEGKKEFQKQVLEMTSEALVYGVQN